MFKKSYKFNTHFSFFINLFFTFLFIIFFLFSNNCFANDNQSEDDEYYEPVYMHPSKEQLKEVEMQNSLMVRAFAPIETQPKGEKSLLEFMPYLGNERHQLNCGNCWVWSNTGAIEIELNAFKNINKRLSIQYLNSNAFSDFNYFACDGGNPFYFVNFYSKKKKVIPWSNENADFKDGNGGIACEHNNTTMTCPNIDAAEISEDPHYELETLGVENIKLYSDTTASVINKVKYYINNNQPLVLDFCFPNTNSFTAFWNQKYEDDIWDISNFPKDDAVARIDCHSTLVVGYNDLSDNEDENYFEVLNSWGTSSRRPNGTFRMKMNMDYNERVTSPSSGSTYLIQGIYLLNPHFKEVANSGTLIINVVDTLNNPIKNLGVMFNDETFNTGDNGQIIIPNLENNLEYNIRLSANSGKNGEYENGELTRCCEYDKLTESGTLDFSSSNTKEITFTKECEDYDSSSHTYNVHLEFRKNNNWAYGEDVTINFNGEIYNKTGFTYQYEIPNIHNGDHYTISFSKDGHIFIPSVIEGTMDVRPSCNSLSYLYTITMYETTNNTVSINVIDENNAPIENETVIFNNTTYKTDANGAINLPNYLKTGDTYDIKIKDERGAVTTNEGFTCYNYNNNARFSGTFDFTENNTKTFTFVRHYNTLANNPPLLISVTDIDTGGNIPNVTLNINGVTYQTNEAGKIFIDNISYGSTYNISYSKKGYLSGSKELVIENGMDDESKLDAKYCSSSYYKNYLFINLYKTKENEETPQNPGSVTIEVKDTNNTPIENEIVKFNDYYFKTDEEGLINITSLKKGQKYNIEIIDKRGLAQGFAKTTCYNYDNKYRFSGTFDFSENNNKAFSFVKHYVDPKERGFLRIYTHEKFTNNTLSGVTINFNESTFETNNDYFLFIENIPFNTHYLITATKEGYFNETRESDFVRPESVDDEHVCTNHLNSISLYLINQSTGITPTNTPTVTNTFTDTYTPSNTFTKTYTPSNTFTSTYTDTPTVTNTFTYTHTSSNTYTPSSTSTFTDTPIFTYTFSNTFTPSSTFTNTSTYTDTSTVTNTYTNSSTFTDTPTATNTFTYTYTPSNTLTKTYTPSNTFTNTSTYTNTSTVTNTYTNSSTFTDTPTATNTFTYTYTPSNTLTKTYTPSNTFTNTSTYTNTSTVTNTYTNSSTFTDTPIYTNTFTRTPSYTNTPIKTNTFTRTPSNTNTPTLTPTHSFQGRIVINVQDILGSGIKDVDIILNNKDVYKTDMYGIAYIFYNVGEEFDINFRREGYLFTPDSYHGELQHKDEAIYINVTMYADDKYNGCNEVKIDLKELKQNVKKINNFASIMKNNDTKIANDYYLKINKLLKQIPQTAMICNEKSKFKTKSFVKTKKNLKNYIINLYKKTLSINKDYKKATKKKASWLKNRKSKLNDFVTISKNNLNKIPDKIYIVK